MRVSSTAFSVWYTSIRRWRPPRHARSAAERDWIPPSRSSVPHELGTGVSRFLGSLQTKHSAFRLECRQRRAKPLEFVARAVMSCDELRKWKCCGGSAHHRPPCRGTASNIRCSASFGPVTSATLDGQQVRRAPFASTALVVRNRFQRTRPSLQVREADGGSRCAIGRSTSSLICRKVMPSSAPRACGRDSQTARAAFERVLVLDPNHGSARVYLARVLESEGDSAGAVALLEKHLDLHPSHVPALFALCSLYQRPRGPRRSWAALPRRSRWRFSLPPRIHPAPQALVPGGIAGSERGRSGRSGQSARGKLTDIHQ